MTALEIISEIEHLPVEEQVKVFRFTQSLDSRWKLSGEELTSMAAKLPDASPVESARVREEIERGFYGNPAHA